MKIRIDGRTYEGTGGTTVERQAQAMIEKLAKYGALEVVRDG